MGKNTATIRSAQAWSRKNSRWLLVVGRSQELLHYVKPTFVTKYSRKVPASQVLPTTNSPTTNDGFLHFEVKHIQHEEGLAVHQHNISAYHSMHVANWRRRQISFNFDWARMHFPLQSRR